MRLVKYEGKLYELVWVNSDSSLSEDARTELCISAIEMKHSEKERMTIKNNEYEGVMFTNRKCYTLGAFSGIECKAEVDTDCGSRRVAIMVTEKRDFFQNN